MNKIIIFFISIIFITGCSLNKNSKFWTKTKNIPEEKNENYKEIFVEENEGVIFSTTLIHSSGKNECDIPRITLLGRYFDYYDQSFIERDFNPTPMKFKK